MGNMLNSKKCSICKKNNATIFRYINDRQYYLCEDEKCHFLSLLRAGVLKKRNLDYLNIEIRKDKEEK